jgi:hypothetical protein
LVPPCLDVVGDVSCVVADAKQDTGLEGVHPVQAEGVKAL